MRVRENPRVRKTTPIRSWPSKITLGLIYTVWTTPNTFAKTTHHYQAGQTTEYLSTGKGHGFNYLSYPARAWTCAKGDSNRSEKARH